jgi:Rrf2 family protein
MGKILSLSTIAENVNVPPVFLHKVFQKLCKAGLLVSHRGIRGGFSLAKHPSRITAGRVVEILQGPIALNRCIKKKSACSRSARCSIRKSLQVLQKEFVNSFYKLTLTKLAKEVKF